MTLPYDELGSGPPVVLLHAGIADRRMWAEHLQPLADAGLRVFALDLPGFGEAPMAAAEDAPWNDVLATLDELVAEPVTLVGNSFGGAVAQRVAVIAPERVATLALISAPAWGVPPSAELEASWEAEEAALEREDIDAAVAVVVDTWTLSGAPRELRTRVAVMQRRIFEQAAGRDSAPEGRDPLEADRAALGRLDVPALVAVGEHDMSDFHAAAEVLTETLAHPRTEVIAAAGHLAPLEQPQAFRELLLSFLG